MNYQNDKINNEMLRLERQKPTTGGAMPLLSYRDDAPKRSMAILRKAVAQTESDTKLEDIKESVNRFKLDRFFNSLSTSIAEVINNYLQGGTQNDSGNIISTYNELCMYIKTVINWKTLSENDRNMIVAKFNELLPQVNELMDVAITEKYTDRKQIEELKNNLVVRNYVPIMYVNYAEAIKTKKPDYATRKQMRTQLYYILNNKTIDDSDKRDLENKIAQFEDIQNRILQTTNKEQKKYFKKQLDSMEIEIKGMIDSLFALYNEEIESSRAPYIESDVGLEEEEELPMMGEEDVAPASDIDIDNALRINNEKYVVAYENAKKFGAELDKLSKLLSKEKDADNRERLRENIETTKGYYDSAYALTNELLREKEELMSLKTGVPLESYEPEVDVLPSKSKSKPKPAPEPVSSSIPEIDYAEEKRKLKELFDLRLKKNQTQLNSAITRLQKGQETVDEKQKRVDDFNASLALVRTKLDKIKDKEIRKTESNKQVPYITDELKKANKLLVKANDSVKLRQETFDRYNQMKSDIESDYKRELDAININEQKQKKRIVEKEIKRRTKKSEESAGLEDTTGKGRYKGRGNLRNAIRKPFVPKNSYENDPSINLYPQYDLSKFDVKRK